MVETVDIVGIIRAGDEDHYLTALVDHLIYLRSTGSRAKRLECGHSMTE